MCLFGIAGKERRLTTAYLAISAALLMSGVSCGGGGSSHVGPNPSPTPVPGIPTSTTISSSAVKVANGSPLVLTSGVSSSATSVITGNVAFFDGARAIGTAPLNNGQAKLQLESLGVGTHTLTARYSGDSKNQPSTSLGLQQSVTGTQQLQVTATAGGQAQVASIQITVQ
jgi:hypothetical protein